MDNTPVDLRSITGIRNLLVLAAAPGDEAYYCGGLIAQACAKGRPPFVAFLTDGSCLSPPGPDGAPPDGATTDGIARFHARWAARARFHARAAARAVAALAVPDEWFLVLGLHDGSVRCSGPRLRCVVEALSMIAWRRDCNLIAVPWRADPRADYAAAHAIGVALAAQDGIGAITYRTEAGDGDDRKPMLLARGGWTRRRLEAISAHPHLLCDFQEGYYPER